APDLAAPEAGMKGFAWREKIAAVMSQGGGYGFFPTAEIVCVELEGQTLPLELMAQSWPETRKRQGG
ncbi:MAG: hypothetical protein VKN56_09275, partial [Cyanobacteriota bacterium]|nr:hypothetical protein [Cyanobacteriota bacterium]